MKAFASCVVWAIVASCSEGMPSQLMRSKTKVERVPTSSGRLASNSHGAAVGNLKLLSIQAKQKQVVTARQQARHAKAGCTWWSSATQGLCMLNGLSRRTDANIKICATDSSGPSGEDRKSCTGHAGAVNEGEVEGAAYAESFDQDGKVGAWTKAANGAVGETDSDGNWQCIEDAKYNWLDFDDCNARTFDRTHRTDGVAPETVSKHADDISPLEACWSCGWVMWYKKFHCKCCDPNVLIGDKLNGEECCDGIDMACGINGHDRRDGTPRGKEVCEDLEGDATEAHTSEVCNKLKANRKPLYSTATRVGSTDAKGGNGNDTPYVHTRTEYDRWLHWDPALCGQHDTHEFCTAFEGCKWDADKCIKDGNFAEEIDNIGTDIDDASVDGFGFEGFN